MTISSEDPSRSPDLRLIKTEEHDGLTELEKQRRIREQHRFLDELESHGVDLSAYRRYLESKSQTFEETAERYAQALLAGNISRESRITNEAILEKLLPFLITFDTCQDLENASGDSDLATKRKENAQTTIINAPLTSVPLKMALLLALESSTPHIDGLDMASPENATLFLDEELDISSPKKKGLVATITHIKEARSYRARTSQ